MARRTVVRDKGGSAKRAEKGSRRPRGGKIGGKRQSVAAAIAQMPRPRRLTIDPPVPSISAANAAMAAADAKPRTIIYVHGIGNKPLASVLKCQWDHALFGTDVGDKSRMAYWVNRQYYPKVEMATCRDKDLVEVDDDEITTASIMALASNTTPSEAADAEAVEREIDSLARTPEQKAFLTSLKDSIEAKAVEPETRQPVVRTGPAAAEVGARVLPLPEFLRRILVRHLTRAFLRDVNDFFFHADRRKVMTDSLLERLDAGGGPFVIVAHSQGTMIAYEVLRHLDPNKVSVPLLVTIGSPLGLQEVQDVFRNWTGKRKLEPPPCVSRWVNVADRLDPVAFDANISNDFGGAPKIENQAAIGLNRDSPRHPHSGTGYLATDAVREPVLQALGKTFTQLISEFVISRDLSDRLEDAGSGEAFPTLIQLQTRDMGQTGTVEELTEVTDALVKNIQSLFKTNPNLKRDPPERLKRFVAVDLTRSEAEKLRTLHADLHIAQIWSDSVKRAVINHSTHTVQAKPANLGYGATGRGIGWAVLDTGIKGDHPHFGQHQNLGPQWDCTKSGAPKELKPGVGAWNNLDRNGHGTHVAATIGGSLKVEIPAASADGTQASQLVEMTGMAPETKLYGFKVLDDFGNGRDSYIIKALDLVAELNENSSSPVIHGVNLSLGGNFDPRIYNVGHTPLCQELRRLWRQGVIVCLAAGNEGWALVQEQGGLMPTNRDLSIGDPANLEEAIAVGSIHKQNPHTYGISYFSSRGPTADGRQKPDLVAPGEKIVSARHDFSAPGPMLLLNDLYVEMSGTSMATPHVSGVIAAFLSIRREFIGYPDRVKKILLDGCTDLERDRYMQGAGMPNLIRMLSAT